MVGTKNCTKRYGRFFFAPMSFKFFYVPSRNPVSTEAELNSFLSSHRVVTIERKFVENGADSFWAFSVDFIHYDARANSSHGALGRSERRVDYREVLSAEQFEIFAKLREVRKEVAEREAVPVYAIFTKEQLAAMVQNGADSRAKLREIVCARATASTADFYKEAALPACSMPSPRGATAAPLKFANFWYASGKAVCLKSSLPARRGYA